MSENANEVGLEAINSKVTVFNCYNEPIDGLTVNFGTKLSIAGYEAAGPTPPKYTPAGVAVSRAKALGGGVFGIGSNSVVVPWDSYTKTFTVVIPDPDGPDRVSVDDDLVLYVMVNKAFLATAYRGYVIGTFDGVKNVSAEAPE